jgi:putative flavoprotein involved in K+ transport
VDSRCWEHLVPELERAGHRCHAPSWPHRSAPEALGQLGIEEIVEHYARQARALPEPPILVGHSFGGLVAQILLDRGIGRAAVALCPAPPRGVLPLHPHVMCTSLPMFTVWRGWQRALHMKYSDWAWGFVHTLPEEERRQVFERYVQPESGRIWYQLGLSLLNGYAAVDFRSATKPLLLVAAGADRVTPPSITRANHRRYAHAELEELSGRPHWVLGPADSVELAERILSWARRHELLGEAPAAVRPAARVGSEPVPVPVAIIGAGPAGLAAAASLRERGIDSVLLERDVDAGQSWRGHYHRLRLHTYRALSGLPGLPIPSTWGAWVAANDFATYLERYVRHHRLKLETGTTVSGLRQVEGRWEVQTDRGVWLADEVVVATGLNRVPQLPDWPGSAGFEGTLLHSSAYKDGSAYAGQDVLVVGVGNSGAEIAVDLVEAGAARVMLSVRTPPNLLPRSILGLPIQATGVMFGWLPAALMDQMVKPIQWLTVGNLTRYGLPRAPRGLFTQVRRDKAIPIIDVGLVSLLRSGRIEVIPAVEGFDRGEVLLAGGKRVKAQVVVAATGYRPALRPLIPDSVTLDDSGLPQLSPSSEALGVPGLYFAGFVVAMGGVLREIGLQSRRIAASIVERRTTAR